MVLHIALVAVGSAILVSTGWFAGIAHERRQNRRVGPRHQGTPAVALRASLGPEATAARVHSATWRARDGIPYR